MKKELLYSLSKKDFTIQTFRSGGPGGQNQNKRETGVRIIHSESGAVGESREHRTQFQNKKAAFTRLIQHHKFKIWNARICHEIISGETIEERVEKEMADDKIKVEKLVDNKWVPF